MYSNAQRSVKTRFDQLGSQTDPDSITKDRKIRGLSKGEVSVMGKPASMHFLHSSWVSPIALILTRVIVTFDFLREDTMRAFYRAGEWSDPSAEEDEAC